MIRTMSYTQLRKERNKLMEHARIAVGWVGRPSDTVARAVSTSDPHSMTQTDTLVGRESRAWELRVESPVKSGVDAARRSGHAE